MSKCFIHGATLADRSGKSACLKIYRSQDQKELLINFDNSCGAFGDVCHRIEACIFENADSSEPMKTYYIFCSEELSKVISTFVDGTMKITL